MGKYTKENSPGKAGELVRRLLIGFFLGLVLGMHSNTLLYYAHHGHESANLLSVTSVTNNGYTTAPERTPRQFFIDLGANDGQSVDFFLSGDAHPLNGGNDKNKFRGLGQSKDWHLIVVEANPRFTPVLEKQREDYLRQGLVKSYKLYAGTAITTHNGNVTFLFDGPGGGDGASINTESLVVQGKGTVMVTALDILTLFKEEDIREDDEVIVKADIEGAEYEVVKRVLMSGLHKRIRILAVEWHHGNPRVFGNDKMLLDKYTRKYECLQWMAEDVSTMVQETWARR